MNLQDFLLVFVTTVSLKLFYIIQVLPRVTKNEYKLSTNVSRIFSISVSLASGLFKAIEVKKVCLRTLRIINLITIHVFFMYLFNQFSHHNMILSHVLGIWLWTYSLPMIWSLSTDQKPLKLGWHSPLVKPQLPNLLTVASWLQLWNSGNTTHNIDFYNPEMRLTTLWISNGARSLLNA